MTKRSKEYKHRVKIGNGVYVSYNDEYEEMTDLARNLSGIFLARMIVATKGNSNEIMIEIAKRMLHRDPPRLRELKRARCIAEDLKPEIWRWQDIVNRFERIEKALKDAGV